MAAPSTARAPSTDNAKQEETPASSSAAASSGARTQLKQSLRGGNYADQMAQLSPDNSPFAVQAKGDGGGADVHAAAQHGVSGGGGAMPHLDKIQTAFGDHDVSGVQAHVGGRAAEASKAMGAEAYATGNSVAFGASPTLHTAAHEAAHVVQQRAGVSLSGGVGKAGDSYEKHADSVADAVVAGKSAAPLLDAMTGGGGGASVQKSELPDAGVVQHKKKKKKKPQKQKKKRNKKYTPEEKPAGLAPGEEYITYKGVTYMARRGEQGPAIALIVSKLEDELAAYNGEVQALNHAYSEYRKRYSEDSWHSQVLKFMRTNPPVLASHPAFEDPGMTGPLTEAEALLANAPSTFGAMRGRSGHIKGHINRTIAQIEAAKAHLEAFRVQRKQAMKPSMAGKVVLTGIMAALGAVVTGAVTLATGGATVPVMLLGSAIAGAVTGGAAYSINKYIDGDPIDSSDLVVRALVEGGANMIAGGLLSFVPKASVQLTDVSAAIDAWFRSSGKRAIRGIAVNATAALMGKEVSAEKFWTDLYAHMLAGGLFATATKAGLLVGASAAGVAGAGGKKVDSSDNKKKALPAADKSNKKLGGKK